MVARSTHAKPGGDWLHGWHGWHPMRLIGSSMDVLMVDLRKSPAKRESIPPGCHIILDWLSMINRSLRRLWSPGFYTNITNIFSSHNKWPSLLVKYPLSFLGKNMQKHDCRSQELDPSPTKNGLPLVPYDIHLQVPLIPENGWFDGSDRFLGPLGPLGFFFSPVHIYGLISKLQTRQHKKWKTAPRIYSSSLFVSIAFEVWPISTIILYLSPLFSTDSPGPSMGCKKISARCKVRMQVP